MPSCWPAEDDDFFPEPPTRVAAAAGAAARWRAASRWRPAYVLLLVTSPALPRRRGLEAPVRGGCAETVLDYTAALRRVPSVSRWKDRRRRCGSWSATDRLTAPSHRDGAARAAGRRARQHAPSAAGRRRPGAQPELRLAPAPSSSRSWPGRSSCMEDSATSTPALSTARTASPTIAVGALPRAVMATTHATSRCVASAWRCPACPQPRRTIAVAGLPGRRLEIGRVSGGGPRRRATCAAGFHGRRRPRRGPRRRGRAGCRRDPRARRAPPA